jgi:hypothetical protein
MTYGCDEACIFCDEPKSIFVDRKPMRVYKGASTAKGPIVAKKHFLIIDTETTMTDKVADLGIVVCDKQGNIEYEAGLFVREFFCDRENHPLFHDNSVDPLWGKRNLGKRYKQAEDMLADGRRMLASVAAINRLMVKIALKYKPVLTAYNIAFDKGKCANSGIDLTIFENSFCLWHSAVAKWAGTKAYRQFVLDNHLFGNRTKHGNMTFGTKADYMAKFILGNDLPNEPHTALEDARDYELPILKRLVATTKVADYMNPPPYNWQDFQVRNAFRPL